MTTGTTTASNLIVPDVWADAVAPVILGKAVMTQLADTDDTLVGQPGERVIFPKWAYIGDADDLTEGVAMDVTQMAMTDSFATIKEAGKAVELSDTAVLTALGNPNSQAQTQLALSVARKIDTDLTAAATVIVTGSSDPDNPNTSPLVLGPVGTAANKPLSWNLLTQGFALWGDEYDVSEIAGIVVHSVGHIQLLNDANFLSADKFGAGAVLLRGQVGSIGTIPLFISDRVPAIADLDNVTGGSQPGYYALAIRKGALALKYKRRPIVETDRDILKRTNVITTNVHYATKRTDDRGVLLIPHNRVVPVAA